MINPDIGTLFDEVVTVISRKDVVSIINKRKKDVILGFDLFADCDARIPGKGVHNIERPNGRGGYTGDYEIKDRPIFRPIQYIEAYFTWDNFAWLTRDIVRMACLHVESCLKRYCGKNGNEMFGNLLFSSEGRAIPEKLWDWLDRVRKQMYNLAKHHIPRKQQHLFSKEDAICSYFICRKLGWELLELIEHEAPANSK